MLKILQASLQQYIIENFQMLKLDLEKTEQLEIKLPTSLESLKKQESSRKTFTSAFLTTSKPSCGSQQTVENSSSQTLTVCEPRISSCSSWIQKRQRNQKSNCQHPLDHRKRKRIPGKHVSLLNDYAKAHDCVDKNKLWKILKKMKMPYHFTCLLRSLCADQEATLGNGHGTRLAPSWKGVCQGYILLPCLFNLYSEYIMRNARLNEAQLVKVARRNINNLRYADDTTLMAESEEELKAS